ncbi:unnamed protein product [Aspergillus oryzae RIB40]|uniref:DNA, SC103 n=1 Tax=Aspergillus oryzae (strain ATCC 42149 / RIB 40) TaxID=510516 RepID=Q2TYD0_ASPOR|nr:unnamed protein product [Aspergillus oryzae RIB40]BAE65743.1 unnamed protein product [Aspergillus oryzae RIB40]
MIDINASVSQLLLCNIRAQANQTFTSARDVRRPTLEASVVYQNVQDYDCFIFDSLSINYISISVQVKHIAMPQRSRWNVDALAFADAEDPETLSMTWTEPRLWSQRLAAGLQAAGGIYQSANPHSNARELAYQFKLTTPHFILASQETLVCALEAAEMVGIGRERVYVFNHAPLAKDGSGNDDSKTGVKHWKNLLASTEIGRSFYWKRLTPSESKLTTVYMIMTSGLVILRLPMISSHPNLTIGSTTGLPKAAEVSHYGILSNCVQTDFVMSLEPNLRTKELAAKNSRWLCTIPLYHGLALCYFCTISVARQYEIHCMLESIEKYRITELHLVLPIIVAMTKDPATFSCAAPLGPEPTFQYESLWPEGQVNIKQGLASTDLKSMPLLTSPVDPAVIQSAGSVGEPIPNCEIRLMDDDENEVEPGQSGEIWFRGPNLMKGQGMWPARMRMGGITSWTERRQVTVDEGLKPMRADILWQEMIKVKGVQVWRAELEALLLDHPAVRDAAVIGVRKDHEEHPRAYIVAAPETSVTSDDILQFVNNRVSTIKRLTGGVVFTNTIPRSPVRLTRY